MNVKRVKVEFELEDGTIKHVELAEVADFELHMNREPRETTYEQVMPTWRTFEPGPLIELTLRVVAAAGERSVA